MKTRRSHTAAPFWAAAAFWVLWAALLPLYRLHHLVLCAGGGLLVWLITDRLRRGPAVTVPEPEPQNEAERFARDCRLGQEEFNRLAVVISHPGLQSCCVRLSALTGQIAGFVARAPRKLPACHRFSSYILPTTLKLLDTYARMGAEGINGRHIGETMISVENAGPALQRIFERQLDALYADEAVDTALDLTVLEKLTNP